MLIIGLGGALGSILRYLSQLLVKHFHTLVFPMGTFAVNIVGCLLIGLLYGILDRYTIISQNWGLFLITGFCGGFTTFSSFSFEGLTLFREGQYLYFGLYVGLSVILGLIAVFFGIFIMKQG